MITWIDDVPLESFDKAWVNVLLVWHQEFGDETEIDNGGI